MRGLLPSRRPGEGSSSRRPEDVVVSFGLYEGSLDDLERIRAGHGDDETRLRRLADHVEELLLDGVFEVVDEVAPGSQGASGTS